MRIAALAITPVMVTRTVLDMTRLLPPFAWAVFFVVAMVYLFIGVQACTQVEQPGQPEQPKQPEQQVPPMPPTVA